MTGGQPKTEVNRFVGAGVFTSGKSLSQAAIAQSGTNAAQLHSELSFPADDVKLDFCQKGKT